MSIAYILYSQPFSKLLILHAQVLNRRLFLDLSEELGQAI